MSKTSLLGIIITIYGVIVLIGTAVACSTKHASISVSTFMILTGIAFALLGREAIYDEPQDIQNLAR